MAFVCIPARLPRNRRMAGICRAAAFIFRAVAATLFISWDVASAEYLPQPEGRVILTVSGNITRTNTGSKADFDLDMLHALGTHALPVTTSWTDGIQEFSGVPMRDLMEAVGATGKTIEAVALNEYSQMIEIEDFFRYPVILATKLNGNTIRVRDKGPLWIVYPLDSFTEKERISIEPRMVWQLRELIVR